jgi:hypothetical protein
MSFQPTATFDGAIFTYTATDNIGVIDVTPAVYTIPLTGNVVLPVELLSFTGKKSEANNLLEWSTSQENNSDHFELEYSADGFNFTSITLVAANGNTTSRSDYSFVHMNVGGKTAYYRLKTVDRDGNFKYSNTILLKRDTNPVIDYSVYPNPFADRVTVSIVAESNYTATISVVDLVEE